MHEDSSGLSSISELLIMRVGGLMPYHCYLDTRGTWKDLPVCFPFLDCSSCLRRFVVSSKFSAEEFLIRETFLFMFCS
jgi:hypothetical protein